MKKIQIDKILEMKVIDSDGDEILLIFPNKEDIKEEDNETALYTVVNRYDKIYSLMYSPTRTPFNSIEEQIIDIDTQKLDWSKDHEQFIYVWGWPGPDYNIYSWRTYGKGWAFTKEEIIKAWEEEI